MFWIDLLFYKDAQYTKILALQDGKWVANGLKSASNKSDTKITVSSTLVLTASFLAVKGLSGSFERIIGIEITVGDEKKLVKLKPIFVYRKLH